MERVAARAATGKASLYSRWPNKVALARAAMVRASQSTTRMGPLTGDLHSDLNHVLQGASAVLGGPFGNALRGIVSATTPDDRTAATMFRDETAISSVAAVVQHAQDNGVLCHGAIPVRVVNLGLTVGTHYFLLNGVPADAKVNAEILDEVWLPLLRTVRRGAQEG